MKLTADQKEQLASMQKEADGKLASILQEEQKKQLKNMQGKGKKKGPGFGPGGPGFGGPGGGSLFRAPRYAADYPGLVGRNLTPGKLLEELQAKDAPKKLKAK